MASFLGTQEVSLLFCRSSYPLGPGHPARYPLRWRQGQGLVVALSRGLVGLEITSYICSSKSDLLKSRKAASWERLC